MSNPYTRYMTRQRGTTVEEQWALGQRFSVRRAPTGVNYGRVIGGLDAPTSLIDPPPEFDSSSSGEASMASSARQLPPMPEIGRPESYYAQLIEFADRQGSAHLHEAAKVGQYVTLALDPSLCWSDKLKFFKHALKRHCTPPPYPDDDVWLFYQNLADLVRQYCGSEALRLASVEDDLYAARLKMGQTRETIENDAEMFFAKVLGGGEIGQRPEWFNEDEWSQLKMLRDAWI
jgi:hypothetical protein